MINIGWFRLPLSQWPKVGLRAAKWLIKKSLNKFFVISRPTSLRDHNAPDQAIVPADTKDVNWTWTSSDVFRRRPYVLCLRGAMGKYQSCFRKRDHFFYGKQQGAVRSDQKIYSLLVYEFYMVVKIFKVAISLSIFSATRPSFVQQGKNFYFINFHNQDINLITGFATKPNPIETISNLMCSLLLFLLFLLEMQIFLCIVVEAFFVF